MKAPKNYQELTSKMLEVFNDVQQDKMNVDKANTLVKTSNAIVNIQRAKIQSTRVTGENDIKFFRD